MYIINKIKALLLLTSAAAFLSCGDNGVNPDYAINEDYEIYSVILKAMYDGHGRIVLLGDSTTGDPFPIMRLSNTIDGLTDETINNYILKNEHRIKLKEIRGIDSIFLWSEYNGSRNNTVSVGFSRVGFNSFKNQALVTIGEVYGPLAGSGHAIFLIKVANKWIIKESVVTWIS